MQAPASDQSRPTATATATGAATVMLAEGNMSEEPSPTEIDQLAPGVIAEEPSSETVQNAQLFSNAEVFSVTCGACGACVCVCSGGQKRINRGSTCRGGMLVTECYTEHICTTSSRCNTD